MKKLSDAAATENRNNTLTPASARRAFTLLSRWARGEYRTVRRTRYLANACEARAMGKGPGHVKLLSEFVASSVHADAESLAILLHT